MSAGLAYVYINSPSAGLFRLRRDDTMTLVLDLSDSSTGQLLARLVDTKRPGKASMLEFPNTVANNVAFRRAIKDWANRLADALDMVTGDPGWPAGSEIMLAR